MVRGLITKCLTGESVTQYHNRLLTLHQFRVLSNIIILHAYAQTRNPRDNIIITESCGW